MKKNFFLLLIIILFSFFKIYATDPIENSDIKLKYLRFFISNKNINTEISKLIKLNYFWDSEFINFGTLINDSYFIGQLQINFVKFVNNKKNYKTIIVKFKEYKNSKKIEIEKIE